MRIKNTNREILKLYSDEELAHYFVVGFVVGKYTYWGVSINRRIMFTEYNDAYEYVLNWLKEK